MNEGIAFEAQLERQQRNRLLQVWIVFRRWPVIPLFILAVMAIFAIFAPWIAPNEPLKQSLPLQYVPPIWATEEREDRLEGRVDSSFEYFLGTDNLGRDILSRIIYGARISLMVALVSLTSGILVGSTLGLIGGWYGGIVDELVARLVDIWYALPFLLVALVVVIVLGQTLVVMMFVLALTAWSPFVRNVRAEVLSLKGEGLCGPRQGRRRVAFLYHVQAHTARRDKYHRGHRYTECRRADSRGGNAYVPWRRPSVEHTGMGPDGG